MTKAAIPPQSAIQRAIRALKAEGVHKCMVRFPPEGGAVVLPADDTPEQALTPLEAWRAKRGGCAA